MSESNKDAIESEDDPNINDSTAAFPDHLWWIAIVAIVVLVILAIASALGAF